MALISAHLDGVLVGPTHDVLVSDHQGVDTGPLAFEDMGHLQGIQVPYLRGERVREEEEEGPGD